MAVPKSVAGWKTTEIVSKWKVIFQKLRQSLEQEIAKGMLEGWLLILKLRLKFDWLFIRHGYPSLQQNIQTFPSEGEHLSYASFRFCTKPDLINPINVLLEFADGRMSWSRVNPKPANATLEFQDGAALREYLWSYSTAWTHYIQDNFALEGRDVLTKMLANKITLHGNLNYLFKLSFIANRILFDFTLKRP